MVSERQSQAKQNQKIPGRVLRLLLLWLLLCHTEQEFWQGLNSLNSGGPGVWGLEHWEPLKLCLAPGPLAGVPVPCPCSLPRFWEGQGVRLSRAFPTSGWATAAPGRVQAGTAGTAPAGLCQGCPSLCFPSRSREPHCELCLCSNEPKKGRAEPGVPSGRAGARGRMCPELSRPDWSVLMAQAQRAGH